MVKENRKYHFPYVRIPHKIEGSIGLALRGNRGGEIKGREPVGEKEVKEGLDSNDSYGLFFVDCTDDDGCIDWAAFLRERVRGGQNKIKPLIVYPCPTSSKFQDSEALLLSHP